MEKLLVVLENDSSLDRLPLTMKKIVREYDGKIIRLTNLKLRNRDEIFNALQNATDILCYSMLVNGSESQLINLSKILSNYLDRKNIYLRFSNPVKDELLKHLTIEQINGVYHHNIIQVNSLGEDLVINLDKEVRKYRANLSKIISYKTTAERRITGKVKIISCSGFGFPFKNLPIGKIVNSIDMSKQDPNPKRGVWVMGNGEPIKLVNDCGVQEYLVIDDNKGLFDEIIELYGISKSSIPREDYDDFIEYFSDKEYTNLSKSQLVCDYFNIPRRNNRQKIKLMIDNY